MRSPSFACCTRRSFGLRPKNDPSSEVDLGIRGGRTVFVSSDGAVQLQSGASVALLDPIRRLLLVFTLSANAVTRRARVLSCALFSSNMV
jgi:hypothetical protein